MGYKNIFIVVLSFIIVVLLGLQVNNHFSMKKMQGEILKLENLNNQLDKDLNNIKDENNDLELKNKTLEFELQSKLQNNSIKVAKEGVFKYHTRQGTTKDEKVVFLTFDDGPSKNTEKILNILKRYDIKATFFVNGNQSSFGKSMYKRIVEEGHAIGNHTYSHSYNKIYKSTDEFFKELEKLEALIYTTTGVKTKLVRLPGGSDNTISKKYGGKDIMKNIIKELKSRGYEYFDWNVCSDDATAVKVPTSKIVETTLSRSKNKTNINILFHDNSAKTTTVEALPQIIEALKNRGYRFEIIKPNSFAPRFL